MPNNIQLDSRIKELESQILYHQNQYYNGDAQITDFGFDALWDELRKLDPKNPILSKIGKDNKDGFKKIKHIMPMGSQHKASNPEEFEKWYNQMLKEKEKKFIVQYKMDGLSIELQYKGGNFISAVTRGDGTVGDDVSVNLLKTGQIKNNIKDFTGAIRGEVLLSHKMKDYFFQDKENCRNAANGCLKRKDGEGCEYLDIVIYDALSLDNKTSWGCEEAKVYWLKETGYEVVESKTLNKCQDIINYRNELNVSRKSYKFDIDGIVIKCNSIDLEDMERDRPKRQIAFKFILEEIHSILLDVEWSASGKYRTPVAICEPVRINGTTVKRASLANYSLIKNLNLKIGDTVILVKRGEIIPKIEGVVKTESNKINKEIIPPTHCEFCGKKLKKDGVHIVCPNNKCPEQIAHRIEKWINTQDIKFIGESTIRKLVNKGLISSISDLYKPNFLDVILQDDSVGNKNAIKICESINQHRSVSLPNFIGGFDIDHVGTRIIESLMDNGIDTLDKILKASIVDLCGCVGIHHVLAEHILHGIYKVVNEMNDVIEQGVRIENKSIGGIFEGNSACFTGSFTIYPRKELEKIFSSLGGKVSGKISSNTVFLVSNEGNNSSSNKTKDALKYHIPIINENEFLNMIRGDSYGRTIN
jgi:DNA ligase (NAD+)